MAELLHWIEFDCTGVYRGQWVYIQTINHKTELLFSFCCRHILIIDIHHNYHTLTLTRML